MNKQFSFSEKDKGSSSPPLFKDVLRGFALLVLVKLLIAPALFQVGYFLVTGNFLQDETPETVIVMAGWAHFFGLLLVFGAVFLFFMSHQEVSYLIRWSSKACHSFCRGVLFWFFAYPTVFLVSESVRKGVRLFFDGPFPQQVAVEQMGEFAPYPLLFIFMIIGVAVIVPVIEEMLFRGFLQTWMQARIGTKGAIIGTSLLFSCAHFSITQGVFNIELLISLFVLSLFLGYLREQEKNLFASIGLHSTINGISVLLLWFGTKV